ncbi:MAG: hypothetical protein AB7U97_25175 [Pirellulales bacterium]
MEPNAPGNIVLRLLTVGGSLDCAFSARIAAGAIVGRVICATWNGESDEN